MPYINPSYSIECIGWNQWNIQLLKEAGFVAGTFDARELLDNEQDRVIHACQSLYEKLVPLTGIRKAEYHAEETAANDHVEPKAAEVQSGYHTQSTQYASAESEVESGDSNGIQRMSLGPSEATYLRDHMEKKDDLRGCGEEI